MLAYINIPVIVHSVNLFYLPNSEGSLSEICKI